MSDATHINGADRRPISARGGPAFSPRDVLFVLFRHKKKAIATFLIVAALAALAAALIPERYVSRASLNVRLGRESVALDPTAAIGDKAVPLLDRQTEINNEAQSLQSRTLAETVAAAVGPAVLLDGDRDPTLAEAADHLQERVQVVVVPDTSYIELAYADEDPNEAHAVVSAYLRAFPALRQAIYANPGSQDFFEEQRGRAQGELASADAALREMKDRTGVADLPAQRINLLNRVGDIDRQIDTARADLAAARASVGRVSLARDQAPERVVTSRTTGGPLSSMENLRQQLATLRIEEADKSSRYNENSPVITQVRNKIAETERMLADAEEAKQETVGTNPVREQLELQLARQVAEADALQAKLSRLESDRQRVAEGLEQLNEAQVEVAQLERARDIAERNARQYAEMYETGRIEEALRADEITNIKLVSPASRPTEPEGLGRAAFALVGLLMAGVAAGGVAFAAEALDHTVKRPEDLTAVVGRGDPLAEDAVSIPKLRSGQAVAKGPADYFDDLSHSLAAIFGTAGAQGSRVAAGTGRQARGFFRTIGHIVGGTLRGLLFVLAALPLAVGNAVFGLLAWPVNALRGGDADDRRRHALATATARRDDSYDVGALALNPSGGDPLVAEYEQIQDEDEGESDRPEPRAAPERRFGRALRLAAYGARRELSAWHHRDERPNLQLSGRGHRTAAGAAVWRAARGAVEQILVATGTATPPATVAVVAARPGSGATTVAAHLAAVLAERVADDPDEGDARRPALLVVVREDARRGESPVVTNDGEITNVEQTAVVELDRVELPAPRTAEVRRLIESAGTKYRHVVLDLPPIFADLGRRGMAEGVREDAGPRLASLCEAAVVVVEADRLRREAAGRALDRLTRAGARPAAVVLNKRSYPVPQWLYKRA